MMQGESSFDNLLPMFSPEFRAGENPTGCPSETAMGSRTGPSGGEPGDEAHLRDATPLPRIAPTSSSQEVRRAYRRPVACEDRRPRREWRACRLPLCFVRSSGSCFSALAVRGGQPQDTLRRHTRGETFYESAVQRLLYTLRSRCRNL